jgi:ATP/maltotriose-dependent transcriptional regulator MalT
MYLSPHTVKSHVVSIYRKLDASSRREAVERSRALGLLEA